MRRLDQLAARVQYLVDLIGKRVREPLAEMVGRVELVNCGVDLNQKGAELLALDARLRRELGIIA